jgi:hypothetical protein
MYKIFIAIVALVALSQARTYPMFKQCDPAWRNDQLGTSSNTICSAGCLMSSASMGLAGTVKPDINPSILNKWLTQNGGYVSGDLFVWSTINTFGVTFQGKVANSEIKANLDKGNIVICNVHNGKHWVIAYGYNGDNILINDPNYTTPSYSLAEIVDGQNGVYTVRSGGYFNLLNKMRSMSGKNLELMADGVKQA